MKFISILGTPLEAETYEGLVRRCRDLCSRPQPFAVSFTNTHVVTLARYDPTFAGALSAIDSFVPDGMPLVWCMNGKGAGLEDRVYGPTFMQRCIRSTPAPFTHYFLGGSQKCVEKLYESICPPGSETLVVGYRNGFFGPDEEEAIVDEINRISPDFIWVGMGTPLQYRWVQRNKPRIARGIILPVGYAFDINSGTGRDAPLWMQRRGLTWLFRMAIEPKRLGPRYLKHNSLFLYYMLRDGLSRNAVVRVDREKPLGLHDNPAHP